MTTSLQQVDPMLQEHWELLLRSSNEDLIDLLDEAAGDLQSPDGDWALAEGVAVLTQSVLRMRKADHRPVIWVH